MKTYSGYEYLQMDVAANAPFDLDKLVFEERLKWTNQNDSSLEDIAQTQPKWKERPLYIKAVLALRKAQKGIPTGHLCGLDAVCSGMQIMSVMSGCLSGARATGLVDKDRRADAYTDITRVMESLLGPERKLNNARQSVKDATMTALYGSKDEPKKLFGADTEELSKFYKALYKIAPGACDMLTTLLNSWQDWSPIQQWIMPDGGMSRNRVMETVEKRIEVDELNHTTFTYQYSENIGKQRGLNNAANVIHSCDAWILRSLVRRCNYDKAHVNMLNTEITCELILRESGTAVPRKRKGKNKDLDYYIAQCKRSGIVDAVILPYLDKESIKTLPSKYLKRLNKIINSMLEHEPFELITIHDAFYAHANNLNWVRKHYRNILAELADANLMQDILSQLHESNGVFHKRSDDLRKYVEQSEYAIC